MLISKILILPAVSLLLSLPALSQTAPRAEGHVVGPDNKPVLGAVVAFDRLDQPVHVECTTDKSGFFGCYKAVNGEYRVTVTLDGQVRATRDVLHIGPSTQTPIPLTFKLSPAVAAGAPAGPQKEAPKALDTTGMSKDQADLCIAANTALAAKQYSAAIENLTKAAAIDPKQAAVWSFLGDVYIENAHGQGPPDAGATRQKAWDAFAKAIEVAPKAENYIHFAMALAANNKLDDARENLAKAIGLDPPGAGKYHYNLGVVLMNASQGDPAVEEFRKSIAADPNNAEAFFYLGSTLAAKATVDGSGKMVAPGGAVESLQKYLSLRPDGSNAAAAKDLLAALGAKPDANPKGKKK